MGEMESRGGGGQAVRWREARGGEREREREAKCERERGEESFRRGK